MQQGSSIRVENLPHISVATYAAEGLTDGAFQSVRPFRILFIKPCQPSPYTAHGPALGILTLIAILRQRFGSRASIYFRDMKLYQEPAEQVEQLLRQYQPEVVAVSALNIEAAASYDIAERCKRFNPKIITVIGGPITLRQAEHIFQDSCFDWIFEGPADRTLAAALARFFSDAPLGNDLPGFSHRTSDGLITRNMQQDLITDLDAIPIPAWDLHDFERSRRRDRRRIITNLDERRYAYLFTSRGCPYLCNYCHDNFTKRFIYQSTERVLQEIAILHEQYGVTEFHIIDDIFKLHRPRAQEIMNAIRARWGDSLYIAFPNGLRGDILDQATIDAMVAAGTYNVTISIETVTPRLQEMVEKRLHVDRAKWAVEEFSRQGVIVHGAFMYGFPTETLAELRATMDYAVHSPMLHAHFFSVVPQRGTPIYEQAMGESRYATEKMSELEGEGGDYASNNTWYQMAYGYPLRSFLVKGVYRFYFHPPRLLRYLKVYGIKALSHGLSEFVFSQLRNVLARLRGFHRKRSPGTGNDSKTSPLPGA